MDSKDFQNSFNELVEGFKVLSLNDKKKEIVNELMEFGRIFYDLNKSNAKVSALSSKYASEVNYDNDDDYYNSVFALIHCIEHEVGRYLDK